MKHVEQSSQSNHSSSRVRVYLNKFIVEGKLFVSICDESLYGKKISTANGEIIVAEPFYGGELVDIDTALKIADEAFSVNLLGEKVVNEALRKGLIHEKSITRIDGIPYAIVVSSF